MMKAAKSPAVDVSPSQKKLKQARLPFKLLSDVPPKPETPPSRKRKLSAPESDVATKVGKVSKENDLTEELIVLSDDEVKSETDGEAKQLNPFVKLVDMAMKKKQQKGKPKKKNSKSKSQNNSIELPTDDDIEATLKENDNAMEVDQVETPVSQDKKEITEPSSDIEPSKKKVEHKGRKSKDKSSATKKSPKTKKDTNHNKLDTKEEQTNSSVNEVCVLSDDSNGAEVPSTQTDTNKPDMVIPEPVEILPVTPKRTRAKVQKTESNEKSSLNESIASTKLDSNPSTPKQNKKGDESMSEANTSLTPKQLQRKLESAKKRELKEQEKQEREQKRQQEKEERDKLKKEKEDQKKKEREEKEEAKKREKEEKEEAKRKEREEKEKLKELEKKQKEEKEEQKKKEREEKEEARKKEREAKEEERRKKQEALELEKQEQELKKKKAAEAFANFFVPKQKVEKETVSGPVSKNDVLSSFTVKGDMRLAPTVRSNLTEERREILEDSINNQKAGSDNLYIKMLREGRAKPESMGKTWPLSDRDDDVMIVEDELPPEGSIMAEEPSASRERLRPKLLSFHENRRPPYWGTWRKRSQAVTPRRPLGQDQKLDYAADSDDDWEEEADGESLDGSGGGSDAEPDDDYEVDNELFVPHGYLSDEEATMDDDGDALLSLSPEAQKARLKHLEDEFETEHKKPTEKLKPRLYGPIWETPEGGKPDNCTDELWNYFGRFKMIMGDISAHLQPPPAIEESEKKKSRKKKMADEQSPKVDKKKQKIEKETKVKEKKTPEVKKNQMGINSFLKKLKS